MRTFLFSVGIRDEGHAGCIRICTRGSLSPLPWPHQVSGLDRVVGEGDTTRSCPSGLHGPQHSLSSPLDGACSHCSVCKGRRGTHVVYPEPVRCRRSQFPASSQGFHGAQTRDQRWINRSQGDRQLPVCSWGVRRERAPRRTLALHPFLPAATRADLSVFDPSITRRRLVRLRKKQTLTPGPRMKALLGDPQKPGDDVPICFSGM